MAAKSTSNISSKAIWGLDFGTTTTILASADQVFVLGADAKAQMLSLASLLNDKGDYLVGESVESDKYREHGERSLKKDISEGIVKRHVKYGVFDSERTSLSVDVPSDEAIVAILRAVRDKAGSVVGDSQVRLACPANWNKAQRQRLLDLALKAGFNAIAPIAEPVAASLAWFHDETRAGRRPAGRTLVFDMGGGTLDVAVLDINDELENPEITVLSSESLFLAGDSVDLAIADVIRQKYSGNPKLAKAFETYPKTLLGYAQELKVSLGIHNSVSGTFKAGQLSEQISLSRSDFEKVLEPLVSKSTETVVDVLRRALLTHWVVPPTMIEGGKVQDAEWSLPGDAADWSHRNPWGSWFEEGDFSGSKSISLRRVPVEDLFNKYPLSPDGRSRLGLQNLVLVGGMTLMPLFREMMLAALAKLGLTESTNAAVVNNPVDLVARGLAEEESFEHLAMDRPAADIILEYKLGKKPMEETLYQAHERFYPEVSDGYMKLTWRCNLDSDDGFAFLKMRGLDGSYWDLVDARTGKKTPGKEGIPYRLGNENTPVIIIQPNGRIFMRDATGLETILRVSKWPVLGGIVEFADPTPLARKPISVRQVAAQQAHEETKGKLRSNS